MPEQTVGECQLSVSDAQRDFSLAADSFYQAVYIHFTNSFNYYAHTVIDNTPQGFFVFVFLLSTFQGAIMKVLVNFLSLNDAQLEPSTKLLFITDS